MSDANFPTDITVIPRPLKDYLERIGATFLNWRRFIIKEYVDKYYSERLVIKMDRDGTINCTDASYLPTPEEQEGISKECGAGWKTPKSICANAAQLSELKKKVKAGSTLYVIYDRRKNPKHGNIAMVHERVDIVTSEVKEKAHFPWTMFSDGNWHRLEPDDGLPFFKPEKKFSNRIMIHEGAKSAFNVAAIKKDHPWFDFLSQYEHWGVIGGAHRTHLARFEELLHEKPIEVVYVCDNDDDGRAAVKGISRGWGQAMSMLQFGAKWPPKFDLGDKWPGKSGDKEIDKEYGANFWEGARYIGPMPDDILSPATWATVPFQTEKGKTKYGLSGYCAREWVFTVQPDYVISRRWPSLRFNSDEWNAYMRSFSDVLNTTALLQSQIQARARKSDYMPNQRPGLHATPDGLVINSYEPPKLQPEKGSLKLWEQYMEHLFPNADERDEIFKWCATLIARPDVRMRYSLLLISQQQGVGKTTLGQDILAPLIGEKNFTCPSEASLTGKFTGWAEDKRLVLINEIYSGHSFEVYNQMKSMITEEKIFIRPLYMEGYWKANWLHFIACSNTLRALKMDFRDRRWLIPKVTEKKAPVGFWKKFHHWLRRDGGLEAIAFWAHAYVKKNGTVQPWEEAPFTATKEELIHESLSPGQRELWRVLEQMLAAPDQSKVILDTDLQQYLLQVVHDGKADKCEKLSTIRSLAKEAGWEIGPQNSGCKDWNIGRKEARVLSTDPKLASVMPNKLAEKGIKRLNIMDYSKF